MGFSYSKTLFISLHFAKKLHENRSGESRITASQMLWGAKSKRAETPLHRCKKGVKCAVKLDQ